jgi:hypothetical protein
MLPAPTRGAAMVLLHSWCENASLEDLFYYNGSAIFVSMSRRKISSEFFLHDATIEDIVAIFGLCFCIIIRNFLLQLLCGFAL